MLSHIFNGFVQYIHSTAALIKSIDPLHMVSTGNEGAMGCEGDMDLCRRINDCPDVDYITIHIWPYNWGWADKDSLTENLEAAKQKTLAYIELHQTIAQKYSKPIVLEEFGYPRDGFSFTPGSATTARDAYYSFVFGYVAEQAASHGNFAGCNFWAWGGNAKVATDHIFWQVGDDYTGDPAQEEQGLNSVFAADSTINIICEATARIAECL